MGIGRERRDARSRKRGQGGRESAIRVGVHRLRRVNSAHELPDVFWRPAHLRKGEAPLDALEVLSRDLVTHDMALFAVVKLLASATLVDTHHGDANGPGGLANRQPQVPVIGVDVAPLLRRLDNLDNGFEEIVGKVALFELAEQLCRVSPIVLCLEASC